VTGDELEAAASADLAEAFLDSLCTDENGVSPNKSPLVMLRALRQRVCRAPTSRNAARSRASTGSELHLSRVLLWWRPGAHRAPRLEVPLRERCQQVERVGYADNCGRDVLRIGDIATFKVSSLPAVVAGVSWSPSPCQDLSAAGAYAGLGGSRSRVFWDWWRLEEGRRAAGYASRILCLENVPGLATSNAGAEPPFDPDDSDPDPAAYSSRKPAPLTESWEVDPGMDSGCEISRPPNGGTRRSQRR
jgi:hypothetical protein